MSYIKLDENTKLESQIYIGFSGPGNSSKEQRKYSYQLGNEIANNDWILVSGGQNKGTMNAVNRGAYKAGGLTLGILPGRDRSRVSRWVRFSTVEGDGQKRNATIINTISVLVAIGANTPGTNMKINSALKTGKPVIIFQPENSGFVQGYMAQSPKLVTITETVAETIAAIKFKLNS
uniref:DNA recombination-mediator protein A n=2 Tax=root TaxID=1 RepID=A0A481YZT4_9VIRU|nr:MAG: hypothetical protein LCMAC202_03960 [Marseillevirus LCMAC202]